MSDQGISEEVDTFEEAFDKARKILLLIGLGLNVWLIWVYLKDTPEYQAQRVRVGKWFEKKFVAPKKDRERLRKEENRTVFEALQIVKEETPDGVD